MRTLAALVLAIWPTIGWAQFKDDVEHGGPKLGRQQTQRLKVGIIVKATGGNLFHIVGTAPVPTDWPEQHVKIVDEEVSSAVKSLTYRTITGGGGVKQMVLEVPQLPAGQEARALVTFEVTSSALATATDTAALHLPKRLDRSMQINIGPSPYIESRHPKIIAAAKQAVSDGQTDWQKIEGIYNWVREHVVYKHSELKGAARALHDREGDADELTSLFVAMCRVHKIPARTVFIVGHCYAEFYLEDDDDKGHWFPCDPTVAGSLGAIEDLHPILQKGDNFKNPQNPKERQRFVAEYFTAAGPGGKPHVQFVREIVN